MNYGTNMSYRIRSNAVWGICWEWILLSLDFCSLSSEDGKGFLEEHESVNWLVMQSLGVYPPLTQMKNIKLNQSLLLCSKEEWLQIIPCHSITISDEKIIALCKMSCQLSFPASLNILPNQLLYATPKFNMLFLWRNSTLTIMNPSFILASQANHASIWYFLTANDSTMRQTFQ